MMDSTILFEKYVLTPQTPDDVKQHMAEFEMAGLPCACASTDATLIIHKMCLHQLQCVHKGFKSKHPTQTYIMTVNHPRQILGTTKGHPGLFNDKTLVLYDDFITEIKAGTILDNHIFELLER